MRQEAPDGTETARGGRAAREQALGPFGYGAIAGALAVLMALVASSAVLARRNRDELIALSRGEALDVAIQRLQIAADDAETGQRGYLLTGRAAYLRPFETARAALPRALASVRDSASGVADMQAPLATLSDAIDGKLAELETTIASQSSGQHDAAIAELNTDRGKVLMDSIRASSADLGRMQRARLATVMRTIRGNSDWLMLSNALGLAVVLVAGAWVAYGLRRYVRALRGTRAALSRANAELGHANDHLERTVAERTADLSEANEEIQRFAYIVSHDLRAPLVNIMGFTSELEAAIGTLGQFVGAFGERHPGELPPEVAEAANDDIPEAIRFIRASTAKMDRLIAAILRLSREGRRVLAPERLDMGVVLAGIADTLRHQAEDLGAEIAIDALLSLVADRLAVEQIFGNLIENALKYLQPGRPGRIRVSGRADGGMARFEIADNGRGIAEKDHERIFDLFRRAGDQSVAGEGIGLAHVRALVRRLGGTIDCRSVLGRGSTFRVSLPLVTAATRSVAA